MDLLVQEKFNRHLNSYSFEFDMKIIEAKYTTCNFLILLIFWNLKLSLVVLVYPVVQFLPIHSQHIIDK